MKEILITGVNSYVGNQLDSWLKQWPEEYKVDKISLRDGTWKNKDFSNYDSIVHVAGIAHVSTDPKMKEKYYRVNRDLTIEVAEKAKSEGVPQFIFLSSIIVYGSRPSSTGVIDRQTKPNPDNFYGKSKLEAEEGLNKLKDNGFKVVNIRPPMIYGKGSKGNYPRLAAFAKKSPIFHDFKNKRSMIHIDNLSEFIRLMIDNEEDGLFFPQNEEYVQTSEMVRLIAKVHGKRILMVRIFNPFIRLLRNRVGILNKVFGDLLYVREMSKYKHKYGKGNLFTSIKKQN